MGLLITALAFFGDQRGKSWLGTSPVPWQSYVNNRFSYGIRFPSTWTRSAEYPNESGIALLLGRPDVEVRVFGTRVDPDGGPEFQFVVDWSRDHTEPITLLDGTAAEIVVAKRSGSTLMQAYWISDNGVEYDFFARAPDSVYVRLHDTLMMVARSLTLVRAKTKE